jgi:hypothetical protein
MARRSLSMQGRVVAAGACLALGGALAGFMAAGDHSATASSTNPSSSNASVDGESGATATPYQGNDGSFGGFPSGDTSNGTSSQPQPQTRSGGS